MATLGVLGGMYLVQGVVYGFAGFVLVPSLAARGVSLEGQAGLLALAGLPWVLKLGWGPILDRLGGRGSASVRPVAAAAMLGMALLLAALARGWPSADQAVPLSRLQWTWLGLNLLLSLQDVATDALAIDRIAPSRRGLANGIMLGGHHLGLEGIGGLVLGATVAASGIGGALWVMAAIVLVLAPLPALLPRGGGVEGAHRESAPGAGALLEALRELVTAPASRVAVVLALLVMVGDVLTSTVTGELLVNRLHWTPQRITSELPPLLLAANVAGYLLAAAVVDRLGAATATRWGGMLLGAAWITFALAQEAWTHDAFFRSFVVAQALATAVMFVGVHAALMRTADGPARATRFVVLMALLNVPRALAPKLAPPLVQALGLAGYFAACGVLQLAVVQLTRRMPDRSP